MADAPEQNRKSVHHFKISGHAHLLTFSCYKRLPILNDDSIRTTLSWYINRAMTRRNCKLIAFVYMPEHVHLLVYPTSERSPVERVLYAIKKPFSDRMKRVLPSSRLSTLTVQERPGKVAFRFWQEGPGHDRNLISTNACVKTAEYLHNNPVRRGLCSSPDQWIWSSWMFYHKPEYYLNAGLPRVDGFPG